VCLQNGQRTFSGLFSLFRPNISFIEPFFIRFASYRVLSSYLRTSSCKIFNIVEKFSSCLRESQYYNIILLVSLRKDE
jgi:hypothetical protein